MIVTICGSTKFIKEMDEVRKELIKRGHEVLVPKSVDHNQDKDYWEDMKANSPEEFWDEKRARMRGHFDKVKKSDAILVLNYDKHGRKNYIGPNTFLEMGIAFEFGKKIFVLNTLPEEQNEYEEILSFAPIVLDGDLSKIT